MRVEPRLCVVAKLEHKGEVERAIPIASRRLAGTHYRAVIASR
jgi:hypothetical protein